MNTELRIDGMTCSHCVAHVQRALAAAQGVTEVLVDPSGSARVSHSTDLDPQVLISAVEEAGYSAQTVTG